MASLMKNMVHWSHNRVKSSPMSSQPVVIEVCEVIKSLPSICGNKPKFVDANGHKHPYCSRSCARNGSGTSPAACVLRGCRATGKPAFANFCSDAHARDGVRLGQVEGCELCEAQPRIVGTMCIPCDRLVKTGPRLREMNPNSQVFKNLRAQFLSEWDGPGSCPSFEKVYEVILPRDVRSKHDQYRASNPAFEEVRSFHASQCICDLGTKEVALCNFKSCGICSIVKSCFKTFAFGLCSNNGRFGDGIYSYRNPALADKHATSCTTSPYRVAIASDVCVEPGQTNTDESVEEESLFVPAPEAMLPVFVIMYRR
ncbi:hypothetical protein CPB83DRAFT_782603 [Crepidotus variabilis]|uniref:PARP catalytic domain-containing protein n=1 Tax=Crepidotus variabilis TaxID=179855 RepID=A0A9P6JVG5_9AGAR|nr:hypothetical protein CPB83DRAFT_782603 [Crepidotus variabilis]